MYSYVLCVMVNARGIIIELFINDGESVMTTYSVSDKNNRKILFKSNRNLNIELEINKLKSSWK